MVGGGSGANSAEKERERKRKREREIKLIIFCPRPVARRLYSEAGAAASSVTVAMSLDGD